jgi:FSR family fosmidomycin resistance protein-like MFS transporter
VAAGPGAGMLRQAPHPRIVSTRPSSDTSLAVILALAAGHFINDLLQSLLPAIYPILKGDFRLDFRQIGLLALANQMTACLLQPVVGIVFDRRPTAQALAAGMAVTLIGVLLLSFAPGYGTLLIAAALVGLGSAVFHPEASRVARLAAGGRHGLAQSLFQTGGNGGSAAGPLLATFVVLPFGRASLAGFSLVALAGIGLLWRVGRWYAPIAARGPVPLPAAALPVAIAASAELPAPSPAARRPASSHAVRAFAILITLVISKAMYLACMTNYFTFFLIERFDTSVRTAQLHLFLFLGAVALGTFAGGPAGDRFGRKIVIWTSILGVLPFSLLLPWVSLTWTAVLAAIVGLVISSAFSAMLVYAQELVPGRVGLVSGLFFGLAFGVGGLAAAGFGWLADVAGLRTVFVLCSLLPALGLLTAWLPDEARSDG